MNFANNIKAIRKEHSLSQEQLAEKLGVSRQSVSKWESNQSYPEMEKILLICKLFDCDIGELMSENIKEVNETKQSKSRVNKIIDDFFDYISRVVELFSAMSFKQKIKCLFEQFVNAAVLAILSTIIWVILAKVLGGIFVFVNRNVYHGIESVIGSVFLVVSIAASLIVLLHIFKIRYLDYYEVEKQDSSEELQNSDQPQESTTPEPETGEEGKRGLLFSRKREKIIIRDPKHSSSKFLVSIAKAILFCIKIVAGFIGAMFAASFVMLTAALVISFVFVRTGLLFLGGFLGVLALLAVNYVLLHILYNFITSKKIRKTLIAWILIAALSIGGVALGLCVIGVGQFDFVEIPLNEQTEMSVPMNDKLIIRNAYSVPINYVEQDRADVKISVTHSKYVDIYLNRNSQNCFVFCTDDETTAFVHLRSIIEDINNKKINTDNFDYDNIDEITVYASSDNIAKLIANAQN